jgi:hypothetical protein
LGIADGGTQVTIVIENTHVNISHYRSVVLAVTNNQLIAGFSSQVKLS